MERKCPRVRDIDVERREKEREMEEKTGKEMNGDKKWKVVG